MNPLLISIIAKEVLWVILMNIKPSTMAKLGGSEKLTFIAYCSLALWGCVNLFLLIDKL
jgi:hypothetical protein